MTRRKMFDPAAVTAGFWRQAEVRYALEHRDIGRLLSLYLAAFPGCTQTQLALITQHDRSEVSNWVRGVRQPRVSDIEVLNRIADGLLLPDDARVLLGLAPTSSPTPRTAHRLRSAAAQHQDADTNADHATPTRIAICGSRTPDTDQTVIDSTVRALAKLVMTQGYDVHHGPVGIGIEVMTYIADHYRPPGHTVALGRFGRSNVVRDAAYVLIIGGAAGTQDEVDLALLMGKKLIPMPASGGTAQRCYDQARTDPHISAWMPDSTFTSLPECSDGDSFSRIVNNLIATDSGDTHA